MLPFCFANPLNKHCKPGIVHLRMGQLRSMFQGSNDMPEWVAKLLAAPLPAKPGMAAKQDIEEEGKATNKVLQVSVTAFRSDL